jgi:hypothetical protein
MAMQRAFSIGAPGLTVLDSRSVDMVLTGLAAEAMGINAPI